MHPSIVHQKRYLVLRKEERIDGFQTLKLGDEKAKAKCNEQICEMQEEIL